MKKIKLIQILLIGLIKTVLSDNQTREENFKLCEPPPCTEDQRNVLWPHSNNTLYYQCVPDPSCGYKALERPCAPGTVFGFKEQVCIWECDWVDPCNGNSSTSSTTSTTTVSSTSTTEVSTTTTSTESPPPTELCATPNCSINERHILWPVKDQPSMYYQCVPDREVDCQWNVETVTCDEGQYFGYKQQDCVDPSNWEDPCDEATTTTTELATSTSTTTENLTQGTEEPDLCEQPACTEEETHQLWPSYEGSNKYWQCIPKEGGVWEAELKTCPNGENFSYYDQTCNTEPFEDVCGGLVTAEQPEEPEIEPTPCPVPDCSVDEIRRKLHPSFDPRFFYVCTMSSDGTYKPILMPCPKGQLFNYNTQTCVDPCDYEYTCGFTNITTTTPLPSTTEALTEVTQTETAPETTTTTTEAPTSTTETTTQSETTTESATTTQTETTTHAEPTTTVTEEPTTESTTLSPTTTTEISTGCEPPVCKANDTTLYPHEDPTKYYQCAPSSGCEWSPVVRECPRPLYFGFKQQVCVWCNDYENVCNSTFTTTTVDPTTTTEVVTEVTDTETEPTTTTESTTAQTTTQSQTTTVTNPETTTTSSPETTTNLPPTGCEPPVCKANETTLYPHDDPTKYYQCAPSNGCEWAPVVRQCPQPLYFGFKQQVCVWCEDFENVCNSTMTTTTEGQTEITVTETEPSTTSTSSTTQSSTTTTQSSTTTTQSSTTTQSTTSSPPTGCEPPVCKANETTLYPHEDPTKFYQCAPSTGCDWAPVVRQCPSPLYFGFKQQVCVWCDDFENVCNSTSNSNSSMTTSAPPATSRPTRPRPTRPNSTRPTTKSTTKKPTTQAPPSTSTVSQSSDFCITPSCKTDLQKNTLWAHPDRNFYYQCAPSPNGSYQPVERPCGPNTVFHYKLQVCVWEQDWIDPCGNSQKPELLLRNAYLPPPPAIKPRKGYFYPKKFVPLNFRY